MATRPSQSVMNAVALLKRMAATPLVGRTFKGLQRDPVVALHMSADQLRSVLDAYLETGVLSAHVLDDGTEVFRLGATHLTLAYAELQALLAPLHNGQRIVTGLLGLSESLERILNELTDVR